MRAAGDTSPITAETSARRAVSGPARRRAVDERVARALDAAVMEVRRELADDARHNADLCGTGDGGGPDDAAELTEPQIRYLAAMRVLPSVGCAMRAARVRFANLRKWRESARFRELEAEGVEIGRGVLFEAAWNAAVIGVLEPVYQGGVMVGKKRKWQPRILELLLKGMLPELFDRKALAGSRPKVTIHATPEQIAEVVRRLSPTARRVERAGT